MGIASILAGSDRPPPATAQRWQMHRPCALSPRQALAVCASLCALNAAVGAAFWLLGYPPVAVFGLIESIGVAAAVLCHGLHACDRETLVLSQGRLQVEQACGRDVRRTTLDAAWLRVTPPDGADQLITLSARGMHVRVGRHLQAHRRVALARELHTALGSATRF